VRGHYRYELHLVTDIPPYRAPGRYDDIPDGQGCVDLGVGSVAAVGVADGPEAPPHRRLAGQALGGRENGLGHPGGQAAPDPACPRALRSLLSKEGPGADKSARSPAGIVPFHR
jgi:hypothetical protein